MDLSKVKLVVSDMDGTLLNSNHQVSERFFELHKVLKEKGILFVAASGRQYNSIIDKLEPIKDEIIVIAENGALTKKREQELLVTPLNNSLKNELLNRVKKINGAHAMLCGKYKAYFDGKSVPFLNELKEYYAAFEILEDFSEVTDEIVKIAVYHETSAETYIYPALKDLEDEIKVKVSGQHWVDLNHINAHKGFPLNLIQKKHNITPAETLVFGDYNNDLEMLALADFSFAMENAHPNVLKAANYKTTSNDDFGVERVLETLVSLQ